MTDLLDLAALADPLPLRPADGPLAGEVVVPGSKSITNRALVCAALAEGTSVLEGALVADDTEAMVGVLRALGLAVEVQPDAAPGPDNARVEVVGCGGDLPASDAPLDESAADWRSVAAGRPLSDCSWWRPRWATSLGRCCPWARTG